MKNFITYEASKVFFKGMFTMFNKWIALTIWVTGFIFSITSFAAQSSKSPYENSLVQERVSLVDSVSITAPSTKDFVAAQRSASGALVEEIVVHAMGREFQLQLEENELFNHQLNIEWKGGAVTPNSDYKYYKGVVKGVAGSWVRLSINDGEITGTIRTPEEVYTIEPKRNLVKTVSQSSKKEMVMYRMSEVGTGLPPEFCGMEHDHEEDLIAHAHEGGTEEFDEMVSEMRAMSADLTIMESNGIKELRVGVIADYEYFAIHGADSSSKIQSLYNQIDGIYREELGIALNLTKITVFNDIADPYTDTTDSYALLVEAGNYFSDSADFNNNGLNQMISGKNFDGSTVGLAYVGTVCYSSKRYRVSLVQNYESFASAQLIVSAHEMGHNLGATHDSASDGTRIMWPTATSSIELNFSERSKGQITPNLSKSCFVATSDIKVDIVADDVEGDVELTATVTNKTAVDVTGVVLTVDMPSDLTYVADSAVGATCTETLGQLSCSLGDMLGSAIEVITFSTTYTTVDEIRVDVTVASDMADYYDADNADYVLINESVAAPAAPAPTDEVSGGSGDGGGSGGGGGSTGLLLLALMSIYIGYRYLIQLNGQKVRVDSKEKWKHKK